MFEEATTLVIVYKDELLLNLLKKLIETNDDLDEDNIVGIKDGSVKIVSWSEKVWLSQKEAGNINNKILFIGKVKGWKSLLPLINDKISEHGIRFGWAGKQALLYSDVTALDNPTKYNEFLEKANTYHLPEEFRSQKVEIKDEEEKEDKGFINNALGFIKQKAKPLVNILSPEQRKKLKQQYIYGVYKLYEEYLEEYINS